MGKRGRRSAVLAQRIGGQWVRDPPVDEPQDAASLVVITDGGRGATAYRSGAGPLARPARPVQVVDTIGAGDAFTAGLLSGPAQRGAHRPAAVAELDSDTLADVLDAASLVASLTCERAGADPPRLRREPAAAGLA
jgi:fructokinase